MQQAANNESSSNPTPPPPFVNVKLCLDNYLAPKTDAAKYEFSYLVSMVKQRQADAAFVRALLGQLRPLVPLLEPRLFEHNLVDALLVDVKWAGHFSNDAAVLAAFADFVVDLSSAYTGYVPKCLTMCIKFFQCVPPSDAAAAAAEAPAPPVNCERVHELAHALLGHLVKVAPACKPALLKQLDQLYPYMTKEAAVQRAYVRNALRLADRFGELRLGVLEICVQRMLKIDVHCRREQIVECEEAAAAESGSGGADEAGMRHELADRLDVTMRAVFEYVERTCHQGGGGGAQLDWHAAKAIYKDLLYAFDKYVLATYGSNHVQFLLFYVCGLRGPLADGFVDYLWKKFNAIKSCSITKQVCAFYLGSLLARARYISLSTCIATLQLMVQWLHAYIDKHQRSGNCLIFELHRTFYALSQTVFYVIIFRSRQLFAEDAATAKPATTTSATALSTLDVVKSWRLGEIVACKLNPLRYCLASVRAKFAKIAYAHQIAYCYKIIDANNRIALPVSGAAGLFAAKKPMSNEMADAAGAHSSGSSGPENPLDSFFPFDPYLLVRSRPFVEKLYVEFGDVVDAAMLMDDEDEDSSDSDDSDSDEGAASDSAARGDEAQEVEEEDEDEAPLKSQMNNKNLFDFDDSDLENSIE